MKSKFIAFSFLLCTMILAEKTIAAPLPQCKCINGKQIKKCIEPTVNGKSHVCGHNCDCEAGRICSEGGYCTNPSAIPCSWDWHTNSQRRGCQEKNPCDNDGECMLGRHCSWPPQNPGHCVPGAASSSKKGKNIKFNR